MPENKKYEVLKRYKVVESEIYYNHVPDGVNAELDGYDVRVIYSDGTHSDTFVPLNRAWKYRRALYKMNLSIDIMKKDKSVKEDLLKKTLSKKNELKSLCKLLDERSEDAIYERIISKDNL